jgi:carbon-monoxide dehydrogenase medium subunit
VKPSPLRYARPASVAEAAALLAEHGWDAKLLAGGQSLVPLLNLRLAAPRVLVDLSRVAGLDGPVVVQGAAGTRTVAAGDLYVTHLTSALAADEVLVEVRFPLDPPGSGCGFAEVAPRHGDYAVGMVACRLELADGAVRRARLVAGAVADRPVALTTAAAALEGGAPDGPRLAAAAEAARAAVEPTDGLHASAAYRRHLVGVLVQRAVRQAWDDALARAA